jgi:type II secretory pathway pseudopilin PulG
MIEQNNYKNNNKNCFSLLESIVAFIIISVLISSLFKIFGLDSDYKTYYDLNKEHNNLAKNTSIKNEYKKFKFI